MRIRVKSDGRELDGTPLQIIRQLAAIGLGRRVPVDDYIKWTAEGLSRAHDIDITVTGETEAERAASLLHELEQAGILEVL